MRLLSEAVRPLLTQYCNTVLSQNNIALLAEEKFDVAIVDLM